MLPCTNHGYGPFYFFRKLQYYYGLLTSFLNQTFPTLYMSLTFTIITRLIGHLATWEMLVQWLWVYLGLIPLVCSKYLGYPYFPIVLYLRYFVFSWCLFCFVFISLDHECLIHVSMQRKQDIKTRNGGHARPPTNVQMLSIQEIPNLMVTTVSQKVMLIKHVLWYNISKSRI